VLQNGLFYRNAACVPLSMYRTAVVLKGRQCMGYLAVVVCTAEANAWRGDQRCTGPVVLFLFWKIHVDPVNITVASLPALRLQGFLGYNN
jgi:hypothetical protein